jgi:cell division protein FtsN
VSEPASAPPTPHKLTDIVLKASETSPAFTPTAVVLPEPVNPPAADETVPDEAAPPPTAPPAKTEQPKKATEKPVDTSGDGTAGGRFTIQVGAYVVDRNLASTKEKVISLGFTPYVTGIKRKMKMFCVIVGEGTTEHDARGIVSALSESGFEPRLLPDAGNTVDVAGGIYYYKNDASAAEERVKSLGYAARIEERTVEVTLKCLRIGTYETADAARKDLSILERNGFSPVILKSDQ